jgi:hypothetical protein
MSTTMPRNRPGATTAEGLASLRRKALQRIAEIDSTLSSTPILAYERSQLNTVLRDIDDSIAESVASASPVPRAHHWLKPAIDRMARDIPYEQSVFLMTKYPDGSARKKDRQLQDVFSTIEGALHPYGLFLRRADQKNYSPTSQLWENVQIHMLGSRYGIAVLESRYRDEFNPNVALEYGFMNALGRDVVLLTEENFKHRRADIVGTIGKTFQWSGDRRRMRRSIRAAIDSWMVDLARPRVR